MSVYKECYIMTQKMKADGDSKQDNWKHFIYTYTYTYNFIYRAF